MACECFSLVLVCWDTLDFTDLTRASTLYKRTLTRVATNTINNSILTLFLYWMVWWYHFLLVDVSSDVSAPLPLKQPYPLLAYESNKDMNTQVTTVHLYIQR